MSASTRPKAGEEDFITLTWEEPPPKARRASVDWAKALEPLRGNKGRWARVRTFAGPSSAHGSMTVFRKAVGPEFECVARKLPDGGSAIYARFIGGAK